MPELLHSPVWKHLMAVGALGLLFVSPEVNAVGGALFGLGFVGWLAAKAGGPV